MESYSEAERGENGEKVLGGIGGELLTTGGEATLRCRYEN